MTRTSLRPSRTLATGALALALLTGCSSSSDDSGSADQAPAAAETQDSGDAGSAGGLAGEDAAEGESDSDAPGADTANLPEGRMIARDAQLRIAVEDVNRAAAEVRAGAVAADGWVVSEEVEPDASPDTFDGYAVLVISVPSTVLDATLANLAPVGRVTGSTLTSQDVTAQYTDTTARIETLEASITRLRDLMEDATGIDDIVALERELAGREADLDALRAVAEGLEGEVERSSITVTLYEADPDEPVEVPEEQRAGFLAGLKGGWNAFLGGVAFLLTALGALLPFAILVALVGAPVLWWRRRRAASEARSATTAPETAGHPPAQPAASESADPLP